MSRMTAAERRSQLIETAREVFLELGYQGARTSDIAQRAGINEALIYRHFASKDDLFEAAVLAPLHSFVDQLGSRAAEFVTAGDDEVRHSVARRVHEELSASMSQVALLLGMALFSQPARGQKLYAEHIAPLLEKIVLESRESMGGWDHQIFDIETVMIGVFGAHFWLALHAALGGKASDAVLRGQQMADFVFSGFASTATQLISETRGTVMTNGDNSMGGAER